MNRSWKVLAGLVIVAGLVSGAVVASSALAASGHQTKPASQKGNDLVSYVASVEGVTPAALKQRLEAGETLFQIAGSKYASPNDLATALLARFKTRLDSAVSKGTVPATAATIVYNRLHQRVAKLVVTPHPRLSTLLGGSKAPAREVVTGVVSAFTSTCHTTTAALRSAFVAGGKTPLAICQATNPGVTRDQLVNALMQPIKSRLQSAAASSPVAAAIQSQLLARIQSGLSTWVVTPLPAGGFQLPLH